MIDWSKIHFFSPNFPSESVFQKVDHLIDPSLMGAIDEYRGLLGARIDPSPLPEAWARLNTPGSQHNVEIGPNGKPTRLSCAGDVFPACDIREAFQVAVGSGLFGGIGVYFDTKYGGQQRMMLHLDIRKVDVQMWWARVNGLYIYAHRDTERDTFYKTLAGTV